MPPKKKGKKKPKNKSVKKREQKGSEGEKSGNKSFSLSDPIPMPPEVPSINSAIFASLQALPITILQNASKTYIVLINKAVEKYLAMAGVTPEIDGKELDQQIKKSADLFSKGVKIVGKSSKEVIKDGAVLINAVLNDKELQGEIKKMMDSVVKLSRVQMKSILQLGDEAIPLLRAKADEVVDIAQSTGENVGKAGIRAGLNAAQAIPGAGQAISIVRMIHAITMPAFKLAEKMTNLWIDTLEKVQKSVKKLQIPMTDSLDKAVDAFVAAKNTQEIAAKKIQAMSNKVVGKINDASNKVNTMIENFDKNIPKPPKTPELPKMPQAPQVPQLPKAPELPKQQLPKKPQLAKPKKGGRRTRKKALKKRHRRKSRRRMR
jgi:hypothetical protein